MIDKEQFKDLSGSECTYVRKVPVGSRDCENCSFHRIEETKYNTITSARCEGEKESVAKHEKRITEIINLLKN